MAGDERVLKVRVEGDTSGLDDAAKAAEGKLGGLSDKLGGIGKAAAVGGAAAIGALGAVGAGLISTIGPAEALGDAQARVGLVFGDTTSKMLDDQSKVASSLGLSKTAYLDQVGALGQLTTSLGVSGDEAAKMATGFTELGPQLAAYAGVEGDVASSALEAALKGKTKALAGLGIAITDADQKAAAMRLGIQGEKKDWTEAQVAQVNYEAVMAKTTNAQKAWADNSGDVEVSMQRIGAAVEDAQASIGQKLLPILAPLIEKLAAELPGAIDKVMSFLGPMFQFLTENPAIALFVAAIGTVAGVLGTVAAVVGPFVPLIMSLVGGFGSLVGIVTTVGSAIGGIVAIFNPVGIVIAAIVAAVVGLKLAWDNNLGGIQEKTAEIVAAVQGAFSAFVDFIAGILTTLGQIITAAWNLYWSTINTVLTTIINVITTAWNTVTTVISDALDMIWTTLKLRWDAFLREISDKLDAILGAVQKAWTAVLTAISDAMEAVWKVISDLWGQAQAFVEAAVRGIQIAVDAAFKVVHGVVDSVMTFVRDYITDVMNGVRIVVDTALGLIKGAFDTVMGALKGIVDAGMQGVTAAFDVLADVATIVQGYLDSISTTLSGWITGAVTAFTEAGKAITDGIVAGINSGLSFVENIISTLAGLLPQWLRDALGWHSPARISVPAGRAVADGFAFGLKDQWKKMVRPLISELGAEVPGLLRAPGLPTPPEGKPIPRGPFPGRPITPPGMPVPPFQWGTGGIPPGPLPRAKLNQTTRQGRGGFRAGHDWETYHGMVSELETYRSGPGSARAGSGGRGGGQGQITGPVQFSGTLKIPITVDGKTLTTLQRTGSWNINRNRAAS